MVVEEDMHSGEAVSTSSGETSAASGNSIWPMLRIATVFGPRGADGYPARVWCKDPTKGCEYGAINTTVAHYWRDHFDLLGVLRREWRAGLGAKLAGKLHVFVGGGAFSPLVVRSISSRVSSHAPLTFASARSLILTHDETIFSDVPSTSNTRHAVLTPRSFVVNMSICVNHSTRQSIRVLVAPRRPRSRAFVRIVSTHQDASLGRVRERVRVRARVATTAHVVRRDVPIRREYAVRAHVSRARARDMDAGDALSLIHI